MEFSAHESEQSINEGLNDDVVLVEGLVLVMVIEILEMNLLDSIVLDGLAYDSYAMFDYHDLY